jgi:hypothetical protein
VAEVEVVKDTWLKWAEIFDSFRVVPRLILAAYGWFVYHVTMYLLVWYTHEPAPARGAEESAVIIGMFSAIAGFTPWIFKIYSENGRNWSEKPESQLS